MIYGNVFLPTVNNTVRNNDYEDITLESIVYEEYCNRKAILESYKEDTDTTILEAEIQVLAEVTIKDIVEKLKKIWTNIKIKIFNFIKNILDKIEKHIKEKNKEKFKEKKEKILKFFSSLFTNYKDKADDYLNEVKESCRNLEQFTINLEYDNNGSSGIIKQKITDKDFHNLNDKIFDVIMPYCEEYQKYQMDFMVKKENTDYKPLLKKKEELSRFDIIVEKEPASYIKSIDIKNCESYLNKLDKDRDECKDKLEELDKKMKPFLDNIKTMADNIDKELSNIPKSTETSLSTIANKNNNDSVQEIKTYADHLAFQMNYIVMIQGKANKLYVAATGVYLAKCNQINDLFARINMITNKYKHMYE